MEFRIQRQITVQDLADPSLEVRNGYGLTDFREHDQVYIQLFTQTVGVLQLKPGLEGGLDTKSFEGCWFSEYSSGFI